MEGTMNTYMVALCFRLSSYFSVTANERTKDDNTNINKVLVVLYIKEIRNESGGEKSKRQIYDSYINCILLLKMARIVWTLA